MTQPRSGTADGATPRCEGAGGGGARAPRARVSRGRVRADPRRRVPAPRRRRSSRRRPPTRTSTRSRPRSSPSTRVRRTSRTPTPTTSNGSCSRPGSTAPRPRTSSAWRACSRTSSTARCRPSSTTWSSCPGVGRKTGNVVRSVAFDLPGLPVDTHVGPAVASAEAHHRGRPGEGRDRPQRARCHPTSAGGSRCASSCTDARCASPASPPAVVACWSTSARRPIPRPRPMAKAATDRPA